MLARLLQSRGYSDSAVKVIAEIPSHAFEKGLWTIDPLSFPAIMLSALLSGERRVGLVAVEEAVQDPDAFRLCLSQLIAAESLAHRVVVRPDNVLVDAVTLEPILPLSKQVSRLIDPLLSAAEAEARALGNGWIGTEHLVLAAIASAAGELASLLDSFAVTHESVKLRIARILNGATPSAD